MALTRIKTDQITDLNVTNAKLANASIAGGKLANNLTYGSDLTVSGNLTVSGTTTSVSTTNTRVDDALLALSAGASGSPSEDAGLLINRGSSSNQAFLWDESEDEFILVDVGSEDGDTAGNVSISSYANLQAGQVKFSSLHDGTTAMTSTTAELNLVDGSSAGTIVNSKAVIYGSGGEVNATTLQIAGSSITATAAELNLMDGGATPGTTAVAGGDGIVVNDGGTMRQTTVDTFDTYLAGTTKTLTNKTLTTPTLTTPIANAGIQLKNGATSAGFLEFFEDSDNGTNKLTLIGPASTGDVTLTLPAATDTLIGKATTDTLTNKTLTSAVLNVGVSGTAVLDEDNFASDSNTQVATQQSIKAYVDAADALKLNLAGGTMSGAIAMGANAITGMADPSSAQDAATKTYVDTADALKLNLAGGTMSGAIAMGTSKITGLGTPTSNADAATKAYVDGVASSASSLTIAADSGSNDTVTVGTDTLTFAGTTNEVNTTVSDNQIQIGLPNDVTIGNDLTVAGNLTVSGTTTTLSTTNSVVSDTLIELNTGAGSNANDLGFIFERGSTGNNAAIIWDESEDKFTLGTTTSTGSATGNITVTTGTLVAALEGNATTASTLASARTIALAGDVAGSASFDGGSNISITATIQADSVALGTDTTGNYVLSLADSGEGIFTITNGVAEGGVATIALAADSVALGTKTTGNYVQSLADAGNSIFTITNGVAEGGAATIDLANDSVALGTKTTGNYVLSIADAGSSQFTITNGVAEGGAATIALANNAVTLGTHTSGNYVATITGGNGIASTGATSGETIAHSLSVDLTDTAVFASDGTGSRAVVMDSNGDFTARNITVTDIDGILGSNTAAAATVTTLDVGNQANFNATTTSTSVTSGSVVVDGGIGIAENVNAGGFISTVDDVRIAADNKQLEIGAGTDFTIAHDGTDTTITNVTGILAVDGVAGSAIRLNEAGANVDVIIEGDSNTALVHVDAGQDNVGIGGAPNANVVLDIQGTSAMLLPRGTTAQRPTAVTGQFRYNTTTNQLEFYSNTAWTALSTAFTLATSQTFTGDGTTVAFTLTALSGADSYTVAGVLIMINGVVQQPTVVYGISGTTLTFTTAPANGDLIEVRKFTTTDTIVAMTDGDGDTQIQVEESADEDIIRFDTAGVERMTIAADGAVDINGNLNVDGNFTLGGNITLGDASSDTITINADFAGNLIPDADGTRTLGDASNKYASAFVNNFITGPQGDVRFSDADSSHFVALQSPATVGTSYTLSLPAADGSSGQALITDGSGALSFGAAGAVVTNDESTNAERLVYVGSVTSGALTAATQDSGFTYNPSSGNLTAASFTGSGASLTSLNGSNISSGTVAANRVATLNQNTTGSAATLTTARAIALSGDVVGTANFDGSAGISISTTIQANSVALSTDTTGNYVATGAVSGNGLSGSSSSEGGTFTVTSNATNNNTGSTIVFRDGSGNFSAGTISATATSAQYADLAEMYAATSNEAMVPGTVVMFAGSGAVSMCDTPNCRAVAGIVSTDPAHLMNSEQSGAPLALAGRVPCKVTGPVAPGDMMVSAGNGMAMANNDAAMGTVIGKAIEAHEGGEGVIEVLAMMM